MTPPRDTGDAPDAEAPRTPSAPTRSFGTEAAEHLSGSTAPADIPRGAIRTARLASGLTRVARTVAVPAVRWIGLYPVLAALLVLSALVVTALTAVSAEVYESMSESDGIAALDRPVLDAAVRSRTPTLNTIVTGFTNLGGVVGLTVFGTLAAIGLSVWRRSWTPLVTIAAAATGSVLMTVVGKAVVGRIRPPLSEAVAPYEHSASFPSGHALNTLVLVGVVAYLLAVWQRCWALRVVTLACAGIVSIAMGLSRVYLGHHWLTDVVVAWCLGLAWLTVVVAAHQIYWTCRGGTLSSDCAEARTGDRRSGTGNGEDPEVSPR